MTYLANSRSRSDPLALPNLRGGSRVIDVSAACSIKSSECDRDRDGQGNDEELEDGVAEQVGSVGVTLLEVEDFKRLEDGTDSDGDDKDG